MKHENISRNAMSCVRASTWLFPAVLLLFSLPAVLRAEPHAGACDRACLSGVVDQVLASMVAHNPDTLPLAQLYEATENSHPAALGMMVA